MTENTMILHYKDKAVIAFCCKNHTEQMNVPGSHPRGGGCSPASPQTPEIQNLKKHSVDVTIFEVLHDFLFSRSQLLKSADD
jgi:hypothetical protein